MADPVSNVEIEDVLSSIRRLVSDEGRAPRAPVEVEGDTQANSLSTAVEAVVTDAAEAADPVELVETETPQMSSSALILTPALRVAADNTVDDMPVAAVDDTSPEDAVAEDATHEDTAASSPMAEDTNEGEQAVQSDEMPEPYGLTDPIEHTESDPQDDTAQDDDTQGDDTQDSADHSEAEASVAADVNAEDASDDLPEHETEVSPQAERSIEDKIAALEALIGPSDAGFEAEASDDAETQAGIARVTRLPWPTDTSDVPTADASDLPNPDDASQSSDVDLHEDDSAFEAARAAAIQDVSEEIAQTTAEALPFGLDVDGTSVIDEDVLRDMVADIVRQELQGPLGERITRNVRKLVRREIYRAMAANELD